jgi:hypothetical protein
LPPWIAERPFKDNWQTVARLRAQADAVNPSRNEHLTAADAESKLQPFDHTHEF